MIKFASVAAVFAVSALIAAPASAANLRVSSPNDPVVRIAVNGKTVAQLNTEISAAATAVCGAGADDATKACYRDAVSDADSQLAAITRASQSSAKLEVAKAGPSSMRVSLVGKSPAQIDDEIDAAARSVCKVTAADRSEYADCVSAAVADAKVQLHYIAKADKPEQLASN